MNLRGFHILLLLVAVCLAGCRSERPTLQVHLPLHSEEKVRFIDHLLSDFERENNCLVEVFLEKESRPKTDVFTLAQDELETIPSLESPRLVGLNPRVMVYSKKQVLEAFLNWEESRSKANHLLSRFNQSGLPANYELEADPNEWDLFDLVVMGVHHGDNSLGLPFDKHEFSTTFAQFALTSGGSEDELSLGKGAGVRNAHYWLRFFQNSNMANLNLPEERIAQKISAGQLEIGFLSARAAFDLTVDFESSHRGVSDLAIAPVPKGASFLLDEQGLPFFSGGNEVRAQSYFLGLSPESDQKELAAKFVQWMTEEKTQRRLGEFLGFYPVHAEVQKNLVGLFRQDWTKDLFLTCRQENAAPLPGSPLTVLVLQRTQGLFAQPVSKFSTLDLDRQVYSVELEVARALAEETETEPIKSTETERASDSGRKHLVFWKPVGEPQFQDYVDKAVSHFEEEHPGVLVEVRDLPLKSDEQYEIYIQSLRAGKSDFDVFSIDVIWVPQFARSGYLKPLGSLLTAEEKSGFLSSCLQACTVGDEVMALPWYVNAGVTFYRKDLLNQEGLPTPSTYGELKEVLPQLEEANRLVFQGREYEGLICCFMEFLYSGGQSFYNEDYTEVALTVDELHGVLSDFLDLFREGMVPRNVLYYDETASHQDFVQGKSAFLRNWPYVWSIAQGADSKVQGRVGVQPALSRGGHPSRSVLGGWQLAVNPNSRHPELAAELVKQMAGSQWQRRLYLETARHPVLAALYSDSEMVAANPLLADLLYVFSNAKSRPGVDRYHLFSINLQRELTALLLEIHTPEEAAKNIHQLALDFRAKTPSH